MQVTWRTTTKSHSGSRVFHRRQSRTIYQHWSSLLLEEPGRHTDESRDPVRFCATHGRSCFLKSSVSSSFTFIPCKQFHVVQFRDFLNEFFTECVCRLRRFPSLFSEELLKDLLKLHFKVLGIFIVFVQKSSEFTRMFREDFLNEFFPEVRFCISKSSDFSQLSRDDRNGSKSDICHFASHYDRW